MLPSIRRLEELVIDKGYSPGAALAEIRNNGEAFDTVICENTFYTPATMTFTPISGTITFFASV